MVGSSYDQHLSNLQTSIRAPQASRLKMHSTKYQFLQREATFLGHIISLNEIAPDPAKTCKVEQWLIQSSIVEVQQFLGIHS